jgi:lipopolysaccharide transport system permease protein
MKRTPEMRTPVNYEIVIRPNRSWLRIPWREVLQYRDLLLLMVQRDFTAKYKQTILGPVWFIIQPLITTAVYTVVFGKIAKIPTDRLPPTLFYLCGNLCWGYFAQCLSGTAGTLTGNAGLFAKVYFPRLVVPLSKALSGLIAFGLQLCLFLSFWLYFRLSGAAIHMHPLAVLLPFLVLLNAALGIGVGLWLSALTAKYRDFSFVMGFCTQLWLYATPVIYPLSEVAPRWRWVSLINPMSSVVESFRYLLLGTGTVHIWHLAVSAAVTLVALLTGLLIFARTERTFIDTV